MAQKPIYKTRGFQYMIIGTLAIPLAKTGVKGLVSYFSKKKKETRDAEIERQLEKQKAKQRRDEEILKSELRQKEAMQKHQYEVEFEMLRHQNKLEEMRAKGNDVSLDNDCAESDEWQPLASQNVGQLVNTPIDENARIKYLSNTYVQNRDIFVLYGPPGIGKSHEVVDIVAEITNESTSRVVIPFKEKIDLSYEAIYYDKEPKETEWQEKFAGRNDLNKIERVPCRDINEKQLLKDIEYRIALSPTTNYVIVIDPITNFDIKQGDTHQFVNRLAAIQDRELASGRNITFILVAHAVKDPKGKYLADLGGSKFWGESVLTVVSFMPFGPNGNLRKFTFDKARNGREVTKGTSFILRPVNTPHLHHNYDEALTNEYCGCITDTTFENAASTSVPKKPKRTGKLALVSDEDANLMFEMNQVQGLTLGKIAGSPIGVKYKLCAMEVSRLIDDMKAKRS